MKSTLVNVCALYGTPLELAFKDVLQHYQAQVKVISFLAGIYNFYQNSSLNRSMLRQCSQALGTTAISTPVGGTRSIPHTYTAPTLHSISGRCIHL